MSNTSQSLLTNSQNLSYQQCFPSLYSIQLSGSFSICLKNHSLEFNDFMQTATTNFNIILHGPFLTAILSNHNNFGKHPLFHDYHLFIPFFLISRKSELSIQLIPVNYHICLELTISFKSKEENQEWYQTILSINGFLKDLKNVPRNLKIPVIIFEEKTQKKITSKMEISELMNNSTKAKISFELVEKLTDFPKLILLCEKTSLSLADDYTHLEDQFFSSFYLENQHQQAKYLMFDSKDILYTVFTSLYILINQLVEAKRKSKKIMRYFAKSIQSVDETPLIYRNINYYSKPMEIKSIVTFEKNDDLFKKPTSVPAKASTDLQLLSFDSEIKRRILIIKNKQKKPKKQNKEHLFFEIPVDYEDQLSTIKSYYSQNIISYNFKVSQKLPFQIFSKFDSNYLSSDSDIIMKSFFSRLEICKETAQICNSLKYTCSPFKEHFYGEYPLQQINNILSNFSNIISMNDSEFVKLCSIFASIFFVNTDYSKVLPAIKELLKMQNRIRNMIPCYQEPFQTLVIFFSRIIFTNTFHNFLNIVISDAQWRKRNFWSISYINNLGFLELLLKVSLSLSSRTYKGQLNRSLIQKNPLLIERKDIEIHYIIKNIQIQAQNSGQFIKVLIAKIINILCRLFTEGFLYSQTAILPELRHGWYCMCLASKMKIQSPEMIAFKKAVDEASLSYLSPNEMMIKALNIGFNCGMVSPWILYIAKTAKKYNLYDENSDIMNNGIVISISDSLRILLSFLVDMSDEELFENIKKCNY